MPVDRMLWMSSISANHTPRWPCPGCGIPTLEVVPNSFLTIHDRETARAYHGRDFLPEMIRGRFVCLLKCSRCHESCAVAGNYHTEEHGDEYRLGRQDRERVIRI
jgi:hypothetical protein